MRLLDPRVKHHLRRYAVQCALATLTISVILLALDAVFSTAIVATLGATTSIVFAMPRGRSARPRSLLGSYAVGILSGALASLACSWVAARTQLAPNSAAILFGGMAVRAATFLMVIGDAEHPPAAGMALTLVLSPWDQFTILLVLVAVLLLTAAKRALRNVLLDLV